jgi:predicted phosphodiesterase
MRIAIFSDVHGNSLALDAVLHDIDQAGGVDAVWFGGDSAALGFDPAGAIQRLDAIPGLVAVRGNTDRYLVEDTTEADIAVLKRAETDHAGALASMPFGRGFSWTVGAVTAFGYRGWLEALPLEHRITLPDGTRVLLVHASPGRDDGDGTLPEQSDDQLREILAGAHADLVITGHTHIPLDRTVGDVRVWNLGSVSNPAREVADTRAMWTLLEADESGHTLTRQYATYDIAAMLEHLATVKHPTERYIRSFWESK